MEEYRVEKVSGMEDFQTRLKSLPAAVIGNFIWNEGLSLHAEARMAYDDTRFYVYMEAEEPWIRAVQTEQNGPIYTDSCLELYLMPSADSVSYFNIEINPIGTMFFSVGQERSDRILITDEGPGHLDIRTSVHALPESGFRWTVTYTLSYDIIRKYIPQFDIQSSAGMRANFYKCGNGLPVPHWGTWSPVSVQKPDFHRPEYFGALTVI